jgi:hypothetical protein
MRILPSLVVPVALASMIAAGLASCKAVTRTIGASGARDISAHQFIEYYQEPRRDDRYWAYIGPVGNHYYMELYQTIGATYPEFVGEVRVPIRAMPEDFPVVRQGRPYPPYVLPEPPAAEPLD